MIFMLGVAFGIAIGTCLGIVIGKHLEDEMSEQEQKQAPSLPVQDAEPVALAPAEPAPEEHFFVYGTLAPGQPNEHILAEVPGRWSPASVRGDLYNEGWGADVGFPGLVVNPDGAVIDGQVFSSTELRRHWPWLDEFEGPGYRRVRVSATLADGQMVDAQVYVLNRQPG